jgi:AraC-like DNA-binding protein
MGDLDISRVSAISGYSRWYLQRLFKKFCGINLGTYIRYRRLSRSCIALKQSNAKVLDIAMDYGFNSQQSYTRAFKEFIGVSPLKFRKNQTWDFSKQTISYSSMAGKVFYFYINRNVITDFKLLFSKYFCVSYSLASGFKHVKDVAIIYQDKNFSAEYRPSWINFHTKDYSWNCNKVIDHREEGGYYLLTSKCLVFPFIGSVHEYVGFYNSLLDEYLPYVGAKIKSNFFFELYRRECSDREKIAVDIIIPIS